MVSQSCVYSFQAQVFCLMHRNNFLIVFGRNTTDLWSDELFTLGYISCYFLGKGLQKLWNSCLFLGSHQHSGSRCLLKGTYHIWTPPSPFSPSLTSEIGVDMSTVLCLHLQEEGWSAAADLDELTHADRMGHKELWFVQDRKLLLPVWSCYFRIVLRRWMAWEAGWRWAAKGCVMVGKGVMATIRRRYLKTF